jgi:hypothetical protein
MSTGSAERTNSLEPCQLDRYDMQVQLSVEEKVNSSCTRSFQAVPTLIFLSNGSPHECKKFRRVDNCE